MILTFNNTNVFDTDNSNFVNTNFKIILTFKWCTNFEIILTFNNTNLAQWTFILRSAKAVSWSIILKRLHLDNTFIWVT